MTQYSPNRRLLTGASAIALAFAGTVLVAGPASAAPLSATTEAELITAINTANSDTALDTITLGADITLTADLPASITEDTEIIGAGYSIDGDGFEVFNDSGATPNIDVTFTGVSITDSPVAIDTSNSNVTMTGSEFDDAPVSIGGSGVVVTITGSNFNNSSTDDGVFVDVSGASNVTLNGSSANGNDDDGFDIEGSFSSVLTMTGNTATGNDDHGFEIDINDSSTATITGTTSNNNGSNGVDADARRASTVTITGSIADKNDQGFGLDSYSGSTITISNSTAENNDEDGFDADTNDSDARITLSYCTSTNNASSVYASGFDFYPEGGTITADNLIATGNQANGLEISTEFSSTVMVRDSIFNGTTGGPGVNLEPTGGSTITLLRITANGNQGGTSGGYGGIQIDDNGYTGSHSTVTISDSTSDGNSGPGLAIVPDGPGGGATSMDIIVAGSTLSNNSSIGGAGILAVLAESSSLTVVNSTISGNDGGLDGTVIVAGDDSGNASFALSHSTIVSNTLASAGGTGGVVLSSLQFSIEHSILAGNTADGAPTDFSLGLGQPDAIGTVDYSLVHTTTGPSASATVAAGTGNVTGVDPMLGPLANNGGPTLTHLPLDDSPVIGAGNPAITGAPANDQRGQTRIVSTIDMGAVEVQAALAATGADSTLPIAGGVLLLGAGALLLILRRRHLKNQS